jgi:phosphoglycerol geranylgeranyltransferase
MNVLSRFSELRKSGKKELAVLVDPDDDATHIREVAENALLNGVELFLVGGSLLTEGQTAICVELLKELGARHVVLFPGHEIQIAENADAILFMSLISGRNPEFLIGKQVNAAPWVKKAGLEAIPTGYMLVESSKMTSAVYMSQTIPLPADKPDIASATALAGELLGLQVFYMDAGSGAVQPVQPNLIAAVRNTVQGVLFIGGGINSAEKAEKAWLSGADVVVIGNGVFKDLSILTEIAGMCRKLNNAAVRV